MKIGLYQDDPGKLARVGAHRGADMRAEVDDGDWVRASIAAARAYLDYTGARHVTVRDADGVRIVTVGLTIHDDAEGPA